MAPAVWTRPIDRHLQCLCDESRDDLCADEIAANVRNRGFVRELPNDVRAYRRAALNGCNAEFVTGFRVRRRSLTTGPIRDGVISRTDGQRACGPGRGDLQRRDRRQVAEIRSEILKEM